MIFMKRENLRRIELQNYVTLSRGLKRKFKSMDFIRKKGKKEIKIERQIKTDRKKEMDFMQQK